MKSDEIRSLFFAYFESRQHRIIQSSSLIPQSDQTLMFTNAGMVQFKSVFTGEEQKRYDRAATIQKCVRAGGKHNDLENVGHTSRHHTFFEMLGNFSFGDYFKKEAIEYAWEFITGTLKISPEKLYVSVYREDDEAYRLWGAVTELGAGRIYRMGKKDNFWQMGDTGPCGPCSEIFYDQGKDVGCKGDNCQVGCDCDRFLEIWNLVFMQYDRGVDGNLTPLPRPSIDTGMGLERIASVTQGVVSNYDTDLFKPLLSGISRHLSDKAGCAAYGEDNKTDVAIRVIADHLRATVFMISDGIMPSNEGRGYVLRRILRRAARHGVMLGMKKPFLCRLTALVISKMRGVYPELQKSERTIEKITRAEEVRFLEVARAGLAQLNEIIELMDAGKGGLSGGGKLIPGEDIFKLHDTFGLPLDMVEDFALAAGVGLDIDGYRHHMEVQKKKSRAVSEKGGFELSPEIERAGRTFFSGYARLEDEVAVIGICLSGKWVDGTAVACASDDNNLATLIFDRSPFYAESGGQVGDLGIILDQHGDTVAELISVSKSPGSVFIHKVMVHGEIRVGARYMARVNAENRDAVQRNHSATHILHHVLRNNLGDHVRQAGSYVSSDRLRFDFTHLASVSKEELCTIERRINNIVIQNSLVKTDVMDKEQALGSGAMAFFDDKYEDNVRVVSIGDFSRELCGGTHVSATGDIGLFKVISETGVAAGVRRIEAVTGMAAYDEIKRVEQVVNNLAGILKTVPLNIAEKTGRIIAEMKEKERELLMLKDRLGNQKIPELIESSKEINGIKVISKNIGTAEIKDLRNTADKIREKFKTGVIHLGGIKDGKPYLFCTVSKDLTDRVQAGNLIRQTAAVINGGGGGKPESAQAGGSSPELLEDAIQKLFDLL